MLKEGGTTKTEYQYHLKDHLGNVRLTFTTADGGTTSSMVATMETQNAEFEEMAFANIQETRQLDKLYNVTEGGNTSARLNAAEGKAMGPWTSVHVMPGDTVRMSVYAKYNQPAKTKESIAGMAGVIASTISQGADADAVMRVSRDLSKVFAAGEVGLLAKDNNVPKAYLNYIFFDPASSAGKKEMKGKETNFKQITEAAHGSFEELEMEFIAEEEGYLMGYTSNQTNEDLNVFMDQMSLTHTTGPIVRVDDYYPFGLTFNTSEREGSLTNKFLFSGKERQELTGWDDFGARMYDSELGRWHTVDPLADVEPGWSPYRAFYCNPIRFVDPTGLLEDDYGLDKDGNISLLRETDDKTDKLIALDDKGAETDKSIEVEEGILDQKKEGTSSRGVSYDYYKIGNDEQATNLFEFVAQNSNVEWSQVKFGTKSNYISTTHQPHSEAGGAHLLRELVIGKYSIREHIHSHPTSTEGPSGFKPHHKKTGDKDFANWVNEYTPKVQLKVYEKKTGKYIPYNHEKVFEP